MSPVWVLLLFHFWVVNPSRCSLCLYTSFSPFAFLFRCVLHPLPLPLSSCLGCIPPLIRLPSLHFYAVASSLFLLSVCFCFMFFYFIATTFFAGYFLVRSLLSAFHAYLLSRFDLVWFRLSCDHGWIRTGPVNVRKQQQQQQHQLLISCIIHKLYY